MDQEYGSASADRSPSQAPRRTPDRTLGWRGRLRAVRHAAVHRFNWSAEDTLALVVTVTIVLVVFWMVLRP